MKGLGPVTMHIYSTMCISASSSSVLAMPCTAAVQYLSRSDKPDLIFLGTTGASHLLVQYKYCADLCETAAA